MFMGKTYFYGKIVSLFGNAMKSEKGMGNMMKMMMMSQMFSGNKTSGDMDMNQMLPMMMLMNGGMDSMFDGMFDFGCEEEDTKTAEEQDK